MAEPVNSESIPATEAMPRRRFAWPHLIGPVFLFDLVRQTRKPRLAVSRVVLAAIMLVLLIIVFVHWFSEFDTGTILFARSLPQRALATMTERFATWMLVVQSVVL